MRSRSWSMAGATLMGTLWVAGALAQGTEKPDWNPARAATARIEVFGADGAKLRDAFGVSVGEPAQILMRLTDLRGAATATARFPDGVEATATAVRAFDADNDLAVLDAEGALPAPAQPDETIKWRFYEPIYVINDAADPANEGTSDPAEIGRLRIVPMTGNYAAGLSVMHSCGRWIGITGKIKDDTVDLTYLTSIESVIPVVFATPSPRPFAEAAAAVENYLGPEDSKGLWARGVIQTQRNPGQAMPYFDKALAKDRQVPGLHLQVGRLHMKGQKFSDAQASFEEAIRLRPDWDLPYLLAGAAANQQGKYEQGLSFYDAVLKRNPADTQLHINRWGALHNLGRNQEALEAIETALNQDPHNDVAVYDLGITLHRLGRTPEAEEQLRKLDEMHSTYASRLRDELHK